MIIHPLLQELKSWCVFLNLYLGTYFRCFHDAEEDGVVLLGFGAVCTHR